MSVKHLNSSILGLNSLDEIPVRLME